MSEFSPAHPTAQLRAPASDSERKAARYRLSRLDLRVDALTAIDLSDHKASVSMMLIRQTGSIPAAVQAVRDMLIVAGRVPGEAFEGARRIVSEVHPEVMQVPVIDLLAGDAMTDPGPSPGELLDARQTLDGALCQLSSLQALSLARADNPVTSLARLLLTEIGGDMGRHAAAAVFVTDGASRSIAEARVEQMERDLRLEWASAEAEDEADDPSP